jgi:tyrosyl-tRNA synthetase
MSKSDLAEGLPIMNVLVQSGFLSSNGEARRALQENSISINKEKHTAESQITLSDLLNDRFLLIQRGKKNYFLVEFH